MPGILVLFHCESNPGFAAASHEITFYKMALSIVGNPNDIHFAYRTTEGGRSPTLPAELTHMIEFDTSTENAATLIEMREYIKSNNIKVVFGFDQPVNKKSYKYLRQGGVKHFVSYWGAPMSSIYPQPLLTLRKLQAALSFYGPDHYIFQSEGMRKTATHGCGISAAKTSIVRTGINTEKFKPSSEPCHYAHDQFCIPKDRKIIFFSGHMEPRKGVAVVVNTAIELSRTNANKHFHFLLLGNKPGQEQPYVDLCKGTDAENHITFGGYRSDVPDILRSCAIGFIASTGWDSFPMSSIEMASTELPLLVSNLPGIRESVSDDTGLLFSSGNHEEAARKIAWLLDNDEARRKMGQKGRARAIGEFSVERQISDLINILTNVIGQ